MTISRTTALQCLVAVATILGGVGLVTGGLMVASDLGAPDALGVGIALGALLLVLASLLLGLAVPTHVLVARRRRSGYLLAIATSAVFLPVGFVLSVFVPNAELGSFVHLLLLSHLIAVCVLAAKELGQVPTVR